MRQMAKAIGYSVQSLKEWENGLRKENPRAQWLAFLVYQYQRLNPATGWIRFALGQPPTGILPPSEARKVAALAKECAQGPGSQRVWISVDHRTGKMKSKVGEKPHYHLPKWVKVPKNRKGCGPGIAGPTLPVASTDPKPKADLPVDQGDADWTI